MESRENRTKTYSSSVRPTRRCSRGRDYTGCWCRYIHTCCHSGTYIRRSHPSLQQCITGHHTPSNHFALQMLSKVLTVDSTDDVVFLSHFILTLSSCLRQDGSYAIRSVCPSLCHSVCRCTASRSKLCMDLHDIFIKGRSWPSLKMISFWRWSGLTFAVI